MRLMTYATLIALSLLCISCGGNGNAAAQSTFSLASLSGSYAGSFSGSINTGTQLLPILGTGIFVADGAGNLTGHETYTLVSTPCEAAIKGTYKVNPDGSGIDTITVTPSTPGCTGGSYTQSLAIGRSNQLVLLSNTNGDRINEEWYLQ
jgi:hypothetical protein